MSFSLAVFSVGFLTTILGVVMVYLSLRKGPEDLAHGRLSFLTTSIDKVKESKRIVKLVLILGIAVTIFLFITTLLGIFKW